MDLEFVTSDLRPEAGHTNTRTTGALEEELYGDLEGFRALSPEMQREDADRRALEYAAPPTTPLNRNAPGLNDPAQVPYEAAAAVTVADPVDREFDEWSSPSGPLAEPAQIRTTPAAVISCPGCGSQASALDVFCLSCGGFLEEEDTNDHAETCSDCGTLIADDEMFCSSCGSVVDA